MLARMDILPEEREAPVATRARLVLLVTALDASTVEKIPSTQTAVKVAVSRAQPENTLLVVQHHAVHAPQEQKT